MCKIVWITSKVIHSKRVCFLLSAPAVGSGPCGCPSTSPPCSQQPGRGARRLPEHRLLGSAPVQPAGIPRCGGHVPPEAARVPQPKHAARAGAPGLLPSLDAVHHHPRRAGQSRLLLPGSGRPGGLLQLRGTGVCVCVCVCWASVTLQQ